MSGRDFFGYTDEEHESGLLSEERRREIMTNHKTLEKELLKLWGSRNPDYMPLSQTEALSYLIEEMGEAIAAAGKTHRWGANSVNSELPVKEQETNADWLKRELKDVEAAIALMRMFL